jgi:hypothetical protein
MAFRDDYSEEGAGAALLMFLFLILLAFLFVVSLPGASAVVTCTIDVGTVTKSITDPVWGVHNANVFGGQSRIDSNCDDVDDAWRNSSWDLKMANESWTTMTRSDMDLDNLCLTYTSADMCVFGTSPTAWFQNINVAVNETAYVGSRGGIKVWTLDSPPRRYADNLSYCNWGGYGDPTQFHFENCGWANTTKAGEITAQFAQTVGCNGTYTCFFAPENEPYNDQFLYGRNQTTGYYETRVNYTVTMWTPWATKLKADCPTCRLVSPSFTLDSIYSQVGESPEAMARSFMANITAGSTYAPECIDIHVYSSSKTNPKELWQRLEQAKNLTAAYGYTPCGTEGAAHPDDEFYTLYPDRGIATTTFSFDQAISGDLGYQFYTPYIWSIWGSSADSYADTSGYCGQTPWYHMVENRNSTPYVTWFYMAYNRTKYLSESTAFVDWSSDDSNVSCVAAINGSGQVYVSVSALRHAVTDVTINLVGGTIDSAYVVSNATAVTPGTSSVSLPTFRGFGSEVIQLNYTPSSSQRLPVLLAGKPVLYNGRVVLQ